MAHECIACGGECYCNGSWDDAIVDKAPKNCESCGCVQEREELLYVDDDFDDDDDCLLDECPYCGTAYDAIAKEYQICNVCGGDAQQEGGDDEG